MSLLFMYVYLCCEVHTGILHLTTAVCLWWHPYIALALFQWSHNVDSHISLLMPGTSLPCYSLIPTC